MNPTTQPLPAPQPTEADIACAESCVSVAETSVSYLPRAVKIHGCAGIVSRHRVAEVEKATAELRAAVLWAIDAAIQAQKETEKP